MPDRKNSRQRWRYYRRALHHTIDINGLANLSDSSILITGATGLIGSAVVDLCLENNMTVYAGGRNEAKLQKRFHRWSSQNNLNFINYDATRINPLDFRVDSIVHAAANAHPALYSAEPFETMTATILSTIELLNYANQFNATLLYVSSSEVYGNMNTMLPYKEDEVGSMNILNPRSCYPSAKRTAETMCASHAAEYGTKAIIARPGHVFGPMQTAEDSRAAAQFARNAKNKQPIVLKSAGEQKRSYIYATDCASALLKIILSGNQGEAYNVASRECPISIRQLAELFAAYANVPVEFSAPTDEEKKAFNPMNHSAVDGTKLSMLGWKPSKTVEKAVATTIELFDLFL